jgi:hypothetical protein
LPRRILLERQLVRNITRRGHGSPSSLRRWNRKAMQRIVQQPNQATIPDSDLVLLVDGLWSTFQGEYWVLYDMAVKPIETNVAYFLDPFLRSKRETVVGWRAALASIPESIRKRVRALVSDGIPGLDVVAQGHGWVHQLCHWHLLSALEGKLGRARARLPTRWLREGIYQAICEAVRTIDEERLITLRARLKYLAGRWDCRRRLRMMTNEFLRQEGAFQAYLRYPGLRLPTTICTMESMHRLLRGAIGTVSNPDSLRLRATAFLRLHPTITCNGRILQQN